MYKLVLDSCSCTWGVPLGPIVLFVFVLLRLVLRVPLWDPVLDELLELVLLGDAAVGTRCPYWKIQKKRKVLREYFSLSIKYSKGIFQGKTFREH